MHIKNKLKNLCWGHTFTNTSPWQVLAPNSTFGLILFKENGPKHCLRLHWSKARPASVNEAIWSSDRKSSILFLICVLVNASNSSNRAFSSDVPVCWFEISQQKTKQKIQRNMYFLEVTPLWKSCHPVEPLKRP